MCLMKERCNVLQLSVYSYFSYDVPENLRIHNALIRLRHNMNNMVSEIELHIMSVATDHDRE